MSSLNQGKLYILSGPSGAGKGTLVSHIAQNVPGVWFSVSATTRDPRCGEVDGVDYTFLSKDEFKELIERDGLLEWSKHFSNYYGTPSDPVIKHLNEGFDVILEIDVEGASQVLKKMPDAVCIFVEPPSIDVLLERLKTRGSETAEERVERLARIEKELSFKNRYNHVIVNDVLEEACANLEQIFENGRKACSKD